MVRDQGYLIQWAQRQTGPSREKGKREKSVRSTCATSDPFASRGARLVLRRPPWGIHVSCHSLCSKGQRCEGFKPWSATRNRDRRLDTGCRLLAAGLKPNSLFFFILDFLSAEIAATANPSCCGPEASDSFQWSAIDPCCQLWLCHSL